MKKKPSTKPDDGRYEKFLADLRLSTLSLISSSSKLDRPLYFDVYRQPRGAVRDVTATYELTNVADDFFDAMANFRLTIRGRKKEESVLAIDCAFEAHFHGANPMPRELADRFTTSELRLVVWPYFRQFVWDMTARMSIPPITIPFSTES